MAHNPNSNSIIVLDSSDEEPQIEQQSPTIVRKFVIKKPSSVSSSPPTSSTLAVPNNKPLMPKPDALELNDPLEDAIVSTSEISNQSASNDDDTSPEQQLRRQREAELAALQRIHDGFQLAFEPPVQARPTIDDQQTVDLRSVFVANVDYQTTYTQLQQVFERCGRINRITINRTRDGQPKGCAYVEFEKRLSVGRAFRLTGFVLNGRPIRVTAKRTNVQGVDKHGEAYNSVPRFQPYAMHEKRWTGSEQRQPLKWVNPNLRPKSAQ